jgi:hypothetical protein
MTVSPGTGGSGGFFYHRQASFQVILRVIFLYVYIQAGIAGHHLRNPFVDRPHFMVISCGPIYLISPR